MAQRKAEKPKKVKVSSKQAEFYNKFKGSKTVSKIVKKQ